MTSEEAVRQWLQEVWDRSFNEGGKLVELLPGTDTGARTSTILKRMEAEGWITRSKTPQPTHSQRAFLGLTYPSIPPSHAEAYGWMPNHDSAGLREALGLTEALRGLPYAEFQRIGIEEERARQATGKATPEAAAARKSAPKPKKKRTPTFADAKREILDYLREQGWGVQALLREPHATRPDGAYRLWFTPQSVYYAPRRDGRYDRSGAHSLFLDLRQVEGPVFVREVERDHELRSRT
jgi:hypothetical protein